MHYHCLVRVGADYYLCATRHRTTNATYNCVAGAIAECHEPRRKCARKIDLETAKDMVLR